MLTKKEVEELREELGNTKKGLEDKGEENENISKELGETKKELEETKTKLKNIRAVLAGF